MLVKYKEHYFIDRFTYLDNTVTVRLFKTWTVGGLLYGYTDRFNVIAISKEDILEVQE